MLECEISFVLSDDNVMNGVNLMCKKGTGLEKLTPCGVVTASSPGSMGRQFYTPIRFVTVDKNTKAK